MNIYKKTIVAITLCGLCMSVMAGNRFIVKYKLDEYQRSLLSDNDVDGTIEEQILAEPISNERLAALSAAAQTEVKDWHFSAMGAHVIILSKYLTEEQTTKFINDVKQFDDIEYIEEDKMVELD
jgi:hypothetical protein